MVLGKGSTKPDGAGHRRSSQSSLVEVTKARLTISSDRDGNRRIQVSTEARLTNNSDGGGKRRTST